MNSQTIATAKFLPLPAEPGYDMDVNQIGRSHGLVFAAKNGSTHHTNPYQRPTQPRKAKRSLKTHFAAQSQRSKSLDPQPLTKSEVDFDTLSDF